MLNVLTEQVENWPHYLWIIGVLILTGTGLPIPEEVPIVAAGVLSSGDEPTLNPWMAFAACMIGALAGDSVMYCIGRFLGRPFFAKYPFFNRIFPLEREKQMEHLLRKHGIKVFFVARFMIGVRAPMYAAAGMMRIPWRLFILIDAICATVVVGIVFTLSMIYGDHITDLIHEYQVAFTVLVLAAVSITVLVWLYRRFRYTPPGLQDDAEPLPPSPAKVAGDVEPRATSNGRASRSTSGKRQQRPSS